MWPLFGIANQMLAAIALCVATTILVKSRQPRHALITGIPLLWLVAVTSSAAWLKIFSPSPRLGFLAHAADLQTKLDAGQLPAALAAQAPRLIFNDHLNAGLTLLFLVIAWVVVVETARTCARVLRGAPTRPLAEAPYVATAMERP